MAIHIAQLMCSQRHCIIAIVFPSEEYSDEQGKQMIETRFNEMVASKQINPWCGLCSGKEFHVEVGRTKYETMHEAMPHVKEEELKQILTQLSWKSNPKRN